MSDTLDPDEVSNPRPPVGVRIVLPGGRTIPVDTVFTGFDEEGNAVWMTTTAFSLDDFDATLVGLEIDVLPAKTGVVVAFTPGRRTE